MELGNITHRATGNECYALDKDRLMISLKTGYDVTAVELCYGDPFSAGIMGGAEQWQGESVSMERDGELALWQIWSVVIRPQYKRCKYYFVLHAGEETYYLLEDGCCTKERFFMPGRKLQYFFFPWMNASDIMETPDWAANTIWYQIFPDRFCNGDAKRDPEWVKPWKCEKVSYFDVYGGDIQGIRKKIPYLKELGITGIYLTPIFASDTNHKYNTTDYHRIDEAFGSEEDLKEMIKEAHDAGIRVMLDAVFNHSGSGFAPWQDVLKKGPDSEYYDWFFVNEWPFDQKKWDTRDGKIYSFAFASGMPKLNTNHPKVVAYFTELCSYWLREWGIDGIRFDVGNEISHSFLKQLRMELKKINPEVYLLGEIWHDSLSWLMGDEYDSVMNYPFSQSINDFYVDKTMTAKEFEYAVTRCYHMYSQQVNRVLFNLLDSHDTERLFTRVGNIGAFFQQLAILFTMEGSPCIYYGTEIAMQGAHDPDCRRCMPWDDIEAGKFDDITEQVKKLIAIRKNYPAARSRNILWKTAKDNERVIWYEKETAKHSEPMRLQVMINASDRDYIPEEEGEILFSYGYKDGILQKDGILISGRTLF